MPPPRARPGEVDSGYLFALLPEQAAEDGVDIPHDMPVPFHGGHGQGRIL